MLGHPNRSAAGEHRRPMLPRCRLSWPCFSGRPRVGSASLGLAGRGDLDLAGDDVRPDLVELALDVCRDLRVEVVERREAGAAVLEVADVAARRELAVSGRVDVLGHRLGQALLDAGEEVLAVLRGTLTAVGVDPHHAD